MLQEVTLVGHLAGEFAAAGLLETLSGSLVGLLLTRVSLLQPADESSSHGGEQ